MWMIFTIIFIFVVATLDCISDLIRFEKWLYKNDIDFEDDERDENNDFKSQ